MSTALFFNDLADHHVEQIPFPKVNLRFVATRLRLEMDEGKFHDALYDCITTAKVYKRMLSMFKEIVVC